MMNTSRRLPYLLLLPGIALLLAILYPFLSGVYWSFTNFDLTTGQNPTFSGIANYLRSFGAEGGGLHALYITVLYAVLTVALQIALGFGVALLLMREGAHIKFFRALIVLPLLMPPEIGRASCRERV